MKLEDIPLPMQVRLRVIEVLLDNYGFANREVIGDINGLGVAAVSKDISTYSKLNPDSTFYNRASRRIEKLSNFKRIFK